MGTSLPVESNALKGGKMPLLGLIHTLACRRSFDKVKEALTGGNSMSVVDPLSLKPILCPNCPTVSSVSG